jgi:prepilin-type N-terminal cleavage/methylation domain-containing protein
MIKKIAAFLVPNQKNKAFTLLEILVVIIVMSILATLGFTQYLKTIESTRIAEAKTTIGNMRTLTAEYSFGHNDAIDGIQNSDVGVDGSCTSDHYYYYNIECGYCTGDGPVTLKAGRCTAGGKTPNASRGYAVYLVFTPSTGQTTPWHCFYVDNGSPCFGMSP